MKSFIILAILSMAAANTGEQRPRLIDGLGTSSIDPDTTNPSARAWFAQGERLVWAFEELEAARAFREAQRADPNCALCYWGEAWALKPTINLRLRFEEAPAAKAAAGKAMALEHRLGERDRLLVAAMEQATRRPLFAGRVYATKLEAAAARFASDPFVATLAAEAQMSLTDWRSFKPHSPAQRLLERALALSPDHSGAIHLYIHLTDWIDRPDLAEPHADRLASLAPAASHLRHMPAHAYFGVGRYADAIAANRAAADAHHRFVSGARAAASSNRERLLDHSNYFGVLSALAAGDGVEARRFLAALQASTSGTHEVMQHRMPAVASAYVDAALGSLGEVLGRPMPPADRPFEQMLHHYARGETLARSGDAAAVAAEASALESVRSSPNAAELNTMERRLGEIYQHVLVGRKAMLSRDYGTAVRAFRSAAEAQFGSRLGNDPPNVWFSTRRSLAEALLASGEADAAATEARLSLEQWPNDMAANAVLKEAKESARRAIAR